MSGKMGNRWKPLAEHEQWLVEYGTDSNIVRVNHGVKHHSFISVVEIILEWCPRRDSNARPSP